MVSFVRTLLLLVLVVINMAAYALPIRSMTADPVAKHQLVLRAINTYNGRLSMYPGQMVKDHIMDAAMWGISDKDTLFFMNGTILSDLRMMQHRDQEYTALYRRIIIQNDKDDSTTRLGVLFGPSYMKEPPEKMGGAVGGVFIYFSGRNEVDADIMYNKRESGVPDMGLYDISWQYRLMPAEFAAEGFARNWFNGVLEYNGRWMETVGLLHQITFGLQWVQPAFVMEVGGIKDINGRHGMGAVFGITARFG